VFPDCTFVKLSDDDVAPLTAVHVDPLFVDSCHWYEIVAEGRVAAAVTLNVALLPAEIDVDDGCAEIVISG
jgi:hypothetical protein